MIRLGVRRIFVLAIAGATLACASGGASNTGGSDTEPKHDRTVITAADMQQLPVSNLLEVVQRLHPEWLMTRTSASISSPATRGVPSPDLAIQLYIDTQHAGTVDMLRQLTVGSAASLKFYSAPDAQSRFGLGNVNGAIQVISVTKP